MMAQWWPRVLGFLVPAGLALSICLIRHFSLWTKMLSFFGLQPSLQKSSKKKEISDLTPRRWRLFPHCLLSLAWAVLSMWLWTALFQALARNAWYAIPPLVGGIVGFFLMLVAVNLGANRVRYHIAMELLDLFELDAALLPLLDPAYTEQDEPSRVAYEAALASAYEYVDTVTYGKNLHLWMFSFLAQFLSEEKIRGWYIPQYPWLQHIGGPALLEVDSEILLVTERLVDPRPRPILPGDQQYLLGSWWPFYKQRLWLHKQALGVTPRLSVTDWPDDEEVESETFFDRVSPGSPAEAPNIPYYRFNASLPKFGRVRYPVLFGLRAQTISRDQILVRTQDGLPLRVPKVLVVFELFHRGRIVREARAQLPRAEWQRLAWGATLRLMSREANHWDIRSATDLAANVMRSALDGAFRQVFARHPARRLLDRVHRDELKRILASWPIEARRRLEAEVEAYLKDLDPLSWEQIHDEILEALNGRAEDGYPLAEARGLLVTQLSFGDWQLPRAVREAHRQAMRSLLAWEGERRPSVRHMHRTRFSQSEAQHLADFMVSELPSARVHLASLDPLAQVDDFVPWVRRGWLRVLDHLLDGVWTHEHIRDLFEWENGLGLSMRFEPDLLDAEDLQIRDRNLVAWLLNARMVLSAHPWGYAEPFSGQPPDDFLGS